MSLAENLNGWVRVETGERGSVCRDLRIEFDLDLGFQLIEFGFYYIWENEKFINPLIIAKLVYIPFQALVGSRAVRAE